MKLDRLFELMDPVEPEQVLLTLAGSTVSRLAGRAVFLGLCGEAAAEKASDTGDWQVLLHEGMDAEGLAMLVQAEPWLPPVRQGRAFTDWLVDQGVLETHQLSQLHAASIRVGWPLFQVAMEEGSITEREYVEQLSRFCGLRAATPPRRMPRTILRSFPRGWVEHLELAPLRRYRGSMVVAVARPLPGRLLRQLQLKLAEPVDLQLASPAAVSAWRRRWLRRQRRESSA